MFKYALSVAACFHMQKDFNTAAEMYILYSVIDPVSPIPLFHASKMEDLTSSLFSIELAAQKAGQKPEYKVLKDRALLTIAALKNELGIKENAEGKKNYRPLFGGKYARYSHPISEPGSIHLSRRPILLK